VSGMKQLFQGLVPYVPWATGYDTNNMDMTRLPPVANCWGVTHTILDMVPPLLAKGEGPPT
jgi:hypothetical protein